ncbi:hypothetical protein ACTVZO_16470 [Streptomyces sp. IBSNAI002]|uniref:hypothetical protein n=1 Tax=Streptomyces sp. IBSNAI002 TaxID=3457500 RepID=UPI003FD696A1
MIKMTWALVAEHADQWTGIDLAEAASVLNQRITASVAASGMDEKAQAHFRESFLGPVQESLSKDGSTAIESGHCWTTAAGPLLVVLSPAA